MAKVAPGATSEEWRQLYLDSHRSPDWERAIGIFRDRIYSRFLKPVDILIEQQSDLPPNKRSFGFTILAIDCLIIETLQAFRWGHLNTERNSNSFRLITRFLIHNPHFNWDYETARRFYNDFRCGILHEAETKEDSLVRSEGALVIVEDSGLIVNRTAFHDRVSRAFHDYVNELGNSANRDLRKNFKKKMNYICRVNELAQRYPVGK